MSRAPRVTGKELISVLGKIGFRVERVRGSHHFLRNAEGKTTVVPVHSGETLGPGLLLKIFKDCDITAEKVAELL